MSGAMAFGSLVSSKNRWVRLLPLVLLLLPRFAMAEGLNPQQQLAFDIYKELVEINTVTATGDTARAAEAMAARLRTAGFADAEVHVFSPAPRKGNLVARLRGTAARKPILRWDPARQEADPNAPKHKAKHKNLEPTPVVPTA